MHVPKIFDVNTHGSLVRFLIKFVKEFNDLVKTVDVLTGKVDEQAQVLLEEIVKRDRLSDRITALEEKAKKAEVDKNAKT